MEAKGCRSDVVINFILIEFGHKYISRLLWNTRSLPGRPLLPFFSPPYMATSQPLVQSSPSTSPLSTSGSWLTSIVGVSFFASVMQNTYLLDSVRLLVLGTLIETGRRLCQWVMERINFSMFRSLFVCPCHVSSRHLPSIIHHRKV